jgi:putative tryptophan/tyrosine transport system substrate-binding protein
MRRREFITLLAAAAWPIRARAQEQSRKYRIGFLYETPRGAPHHAALFDELRRAGFVEGQNLELDWQGFGLRIEQLAQHAAELAKSRVDVIVCGGDLAIRAAQKATATVPIVALTDDMVGQGLVTSMAEHGGNMTGVSIFATELDGKRQEILIEAIPGLQRIATLIDSNTTPMRQLEALADAAHARGVELSLYQVTKLDQIVPAINAAKTSGDSAVNVLASPLLFANSPLIIERLSALRLPAVYQWPEMAEQGGLIGYGPRIIQIYREMIARQLIKLLRGARPADLPVEQPTRFDLVINLKTAKVLGIDLPASLVLRADQLIE